MDFSLEPSRYLHIPPKNKDTMTFDEVRVKAPYLILYYFYQSFLTSSIPAVRYR